jgi:hypothetical protein
MYAILLSDYADLSPGLGGTGSVAAPALRPSYNCYSQARTARIRSLASLKT